MKLRILILISKFLNSRVLIKLEPFDIGVTLGLQSYPKKRASITDANSLLPDG